MPIKENAKKALRQSIKNALRNKLVKAELVSLRVKFRKLRDGKMAKEATDVARLISKKLDKAVSSGIMKKNTVARLKSRLMKHVNVLNKA